MMKPTEKRVNDGIEGFGLNVTLRAGDVAGNNKVVCFTPMSGLLSQEKFADQVLSVASRVGGCWQS